MKKQLFLTLFLMFLVVLGGITLLAKGDELWKKDYTKTDEFYALEEDFVNGLMKYVLNPFDLKQAEQQLTVTDGEVDYYRHYYGTKEEQLQNVMAQYENREETEAMIAERDAKIAEIEKNFTSDEAVQAKILEVKNKAIKAYVQQMEREKRDFLERYDYFSYELKEIGGGIKAQSGNLSSPIYSNTFTASNPLNAPGDYFISIDQTVGNLRIGLAEETIEVYQKKKEFTGEIKISKVNSSATDIASGITYYKVSFYVTLVVVLIGLVAFVLLIARRVKVVHFIGVMDGLENKFNSWPIDLRLAVVFVFGFLIIFELDMMPFHVERIVYLITDDYVEVGSTVISMMTRLAYGFFIFSGLVLTGIWTLVSFQNEKGLFEQSILYRIMHALREAFLNRSIGLQMAILLAVVFMTALSLGLAFADGSFAIIFIVLFFGGFMPALLIFIRRFGYLNRILKETKEMAEGRTSKPIKIKGSSPLAAHARNLNAMREGVELSIREQAKSERLKTELITNVSHDLRTPLTSIITYTDLLKNPDLPAEERAKYVNIVDQKSARLKTLIEDLFEVSKMASGNMEIHKARVDLALMLQQIAAEHEEDYTKHGLDLRVTIEEQPIFAQADGQKWWRVYDNLLVNARKYSMPNTRVYSTLKVAEGQAVFTIKNIASYELNESADELVERFKRADESRHTEGSGLGLAIAQSIVDLHGGQLKIEVDGDLFKVTVLLPL